MKFDNTDFNEKWVSSFATVGDFLHAMNEPGYQHIFAGREDRIKRVKEVYRLIVKSQKKVVAGLVDSDSNGAGKAAPISIEVAE